MRKPRGNVFSYCGRILSMLFGVFLKIIRKLKNNIALFLSLITAIALIWQTCNLSKSVELYQEELQSEQKPIILHMLGYSTPTRLQDSSLIVTEILQNIGSMPAHNLAWHHAVRNDSEYPFDHFDEIISTSSPSRNILNPGIPIVDEISVSFNTNHEWSSLSELAYYMYSNNVVTYVHFCVYYNDIASRSYILRETFGLYGNSDSTLEWHQEYATETEQSN